ncbi:hypothetical protein SGPA1_31555 [Streptomyces misionensis JCM 4497]
MACRVRVRLPRRGAPRPHGGGRAGRGRRHRLRAVRFGARAHPRADHLQRPAPGPRGLRQVPRERTRPPRHPRARPAAGPHRHRPRPRTGRPVRRPGGHPSRQRVPHPAAPLRHPGGVRQGGRLPAVPGGLLSDGAHGAGGRGDAARLLSRRSSVSSPSPPGA